MRMIRSRAAERGARWDNVKGLVFKAFVIQERGFHGAAGNTYSSIYLWSDEREAARFLMGSGFQSVVDMFGRPPIDIWLPVDFREGPSAHARFLVREDIQLRGGVDREEELLNQIKENELVAKSPDTHLALAGLDVSTWRLVRFVLRSTPPESGPTKGVFEVLYLARPRVSAGQR
jgi:Domain of unknown function (DUF4865)